MNIYYLLPYRISYDPTRYPKYIPEAYCLCKGCLMGIFGEENFHFRSTPVYMPTVILRRTSSCAGGRYVYTEDYVTIPVGCTCVPEQEKEAESVNSSIDKQEMKLLVSQNKPSSEWIIYEESCYSIGFTSSFHHLKKLHHSSKHVDLPSFSAYNYFSYKMESFVQSLRLLEMTIHIKNLLSSCKYSLQIPK